jgi:Uma2 family endonuclease
MAIAAQRIPTFEELYAAIAALPEGISGEILEDGRIDTMGRPGRAHLRAGKRLTRLLGPIEDDDERDGWVIEIEREVRLLGSRLAVPDLVGFRVVDGDDAFLDANPVTRRPDWACEMLSASTERRDRTDKLPLYARAGVPHVWLVDPDACFVEVYQEREGVPVQVAVGRGVEVVRLPPFVDIELDLGRLWGPRR